MLRGQGGSRRRSADAAAEGFSGGYARLFTTACSIESQDRSRLARVLDDLVGVVRVAKVRAREEKGRLAELEVWREREALVSLSLVSADCNISMIPSNPISFCGPKPSEIPISPPTISAPFSARTRPRTTSGASGGTASAVPDRLYGFAVESRAGNEGLMREHTRVRESLNNFTGSCSWVRVGSTTFVSGFADYLIENETDVAWMAHTSEAFLTAGSSRELQGSRLDRSWTDQLKNGPQEPRPSDPALQPPYYGSFGPPMPSPQRGGLSWEMDQRWDLAVSDMSPRLRSTQAQDTALGRLRAFDNNPPDWMTNGQVPYVAEEAARALHRFGLSIGVVANTISGKDLHIFDDGTPYVGEITALKPGRSSGLNDVVATTMDTYDRGDADRNSINLTSVEGADGNVRYVAAIPGTAERTIVGAAAWTGVPSGLDWAANAIHLSNGPTSATRAASQAVQDAIDADIKYRTKNGMQLPKGTPEVLLTGHSQGGIIAGQLTTSDEFLSGLDVKGIVSMGSPPRNPAHEPRRAGIQLPKPAGPHPTAGHERFTYRRQHRPRRRRHQHHRAALRIDIESYALHTLVHPHANDIQS